MSESPSNPVEITAVHCPDSCNIPAAEKGCHFQMGPEAFTCTKCQLKIRRSYRGCLLNCADLDEMLHGLKITAEVKTLQKSGKEFKSRLVFDETYRVCLAPKSRAVARQETQEVCPKCGAKIHVITKGDGAKYYGCAGFPKCLYARKHVPHTFNRYPVSPQASPPARLEQAKAEPVRKAAEAAPPPAPAIPATEPKPEPPPAETVEPTVEPGPLLDPFGTPAAGLPPQQGGIAIMTDPLPLPPDLHEPLFEGSSDKYRRIPRFVKELLRL